jgi:signal transduction histidine kinase
VTRWRGTVRTRLTLLYVGLFLTTSTVVFVLANLLLQQALSHRVLAIIESSGPPPDPTLPSPPHLNVRKVAGLPDTILRYQWTVTAVTIAVLAVLSVLTGWWLAGRVLRPLHRITATARRLSVSNLHERIALAGPRDELTELADTFDAMLDRLERSVDSQRRFIANAAHELRTPLAVQRAAIQIGLDTAPEAGPPSPERLAEVRETLLAANKRTERLIDALLILAQAEHGLDATEPVRLDRTVRQAADEAAGVAADREVTVDVAAEAVTVDGDPVLLHRLVANVLDNGIRYNRAGGTVAVTLTAAGELTVRNTGPEVPPERVAELFQPFRRLNGSRTRDGGSGLGLSIVVSIAQAHAAVPAARPRHGGGLELRIAFPPAPPAAPAG